MGVVIQFKKLDPQAIQPAYLSAGAAGFDLSSLESVTLKMGEVTLVRTGIALEIPNGYEVQIRARSGLAAKHGVFLVNGVGTIDSDYRGEIKIILSTCSSTPIVLKAGDRIAQGVVQKVERALLLEADSLSNTIRGDGGFGSTGLRAQ